LVERFFRIDSAFNMMWGAIGDDAIERGVGLRGIADIGVLGRRSGDFTASDVRSLRPRVGCWRVRPELVDRLER
jgi:hypothetical protein